MDDGVALVDEGLLGVSDHHAGSRRPRSAELTADRIANGRDHLAALDELPELDVDQGDPAPAHAHPRTRPALGGRFGGDGSVERHRFVDGLDHSETGQHPTDAGDTRIDRSTIEPPGFATFVEQHGRPRRGRCCTHRAVAELGVHHERRPERDRQVAGAVVVEVGADLRQVRAMVGPGVEVDSDIAPLDDLGHEQVGDARSKRPVRRSGERPVEVAAIREVAVAVEEPVHVDDGNGHDRARKGLRVDRCESAADDLDPTDLVAVHRRTQPDHGAVVATVEHIDRNRHLRAGDETRDRELADRRTSGGHVEVSDRERRTPEQAATPGRLGLGGHRGLGGDIGSGVGHDRSRLRRRVIRSGRPVT